LAIISIPRQFAKLNSSPNFPVIQYSIFCYALLDMMKYRVVISKTETIERFCGALSRGIDPDVRCHGL